MATGNVRQSAQERIERMEAERLSRISSRVSNCLSHMRHGPASGPRNPILDGEYHWVREIAHGSFCSANLIRDYKSGRELAIKIEYLEIMPPDYDDSLGISSLETEIRALTKIASPHVPQVYAHNLRPNHGIADERDGCELYCVMDFIQGETLWETESKLDLAGLFQVAIQISRAMEAAHLASICHRDIGEDNIMVSYDADGARFSTLIDFGIAKILPPDPSCPDHFGPTFIPNPFDRDPAALRFEDMDERSDIYMLGLTLASNMGIYRGTGGIDPERARGKFTNGLIPPEAIDTIAKAMEKDPGKRFQSAHEMRAALERALQAIEAQTTKLRG